MRKSSIIIAIVCLLAGCGGKKTLADYELSVDSIVVDTVVLLNKSSRSPRCTLHLNVKTLHGPNAEQMNDSVLRGGVLPADYLSLTDERLTPRMAVDSFVKRYIADYRLFYGKVYDEEPGAGTSDLSCQVETEVQMGRRGIINYIAHKCDQSGGASLDYTQVLNLDAETGLILHLWDLFDAGDIKGLGQEIASSLASTLSLPDTVALREQGYFVHTPFYAPDNYIVDDDGMLFIFIPGEIAEQGKGEVRVRL